MESFNLELMYFEIDDDPKKQFKDTSKNIN